MWDSINPNEITIPKHHIAETIRRIEAIRKGEVSLSSWEGIRKRIYSHQ
ncbi:MAG: addiction module protein [Chitinophagales bacterium]|nr:addiction module protein [Chitinophagales bacterium]